ncbi:glycosyl hydrolase 115 family protein [Gorillibacterium sp. sgz5001074]|uniref:glycosyl hydrolase 115 family protein n=1 Tax=Gorillibacterium sp. sgz5001074 TaxID=3446695 RepID=UPI003F66BA48
MSLVRWVQDTYTGNEFPLFHGGLAVELCVSEEDYPGVGRAAKDLQMDMKRVTGRMPRLRYGLPESESAVIIGTVGRSPVIDALIDAGKLDAGHLPGKWESFVLQTVEDPAPGIREALVIAGSDKRGTIYGIYELSEQIGVSPWYWWADVPVQRKETLAVRRGVYKQGEPSVKYRGIFLNDEGPSLMTWARANFPDFTHEFYEKVFELILRLKGNYLWPAMWDSAFNEDDPLNPAVADEYGIVMGTSHHEPMVRSHGEWKKHGRGAWDYSVNGEFLHRFWEEGIERNRAYESIVTLGMRGDGDEAMGGKLTFQEKIELLQRIVEDQRRIIADKMNPQVERVPQLWALYKEVQEYYESGMRVPDDVTLLWSDDNHGNLRRVPTEEERKRSGGAGIYYHLDYVGGPRSYKWINTVPLPKIWEQMHKAYEYGADRIWILNVGDLKPMELPTDYFLRLAWNVQDHTADQIGAFTLHWAERQFGPEFAADIAYMLERYTKLNGRLKPELLNAVPLYSWTDYREAERVLAEFREIAELAVQVGDRVPEPLQDAYFQLVEYPVRASAVVVELQLRAVQNRLYAEQGRAAAACLAADRVEALFEEDARLSFYYNKRLSFGKWDHMMDQTHIGYTYWNQPERNTLPELLRPEVPAEGRLGVALEGSASAWPGAHEPCVLPALDAYAREPRYVELFNRGAGALTFRASADAGWIKLSLVEGPVGAGVRLTVDADWDTAPIGMDVRGSVHITASCGTEVRVEVRLFHPSAPAREELTGFVEGADGCISIEAEHYNASWDAGGAGWRRIPDYGRTLSSMAVFPVTAPSVNPPHHSPCLEYQVHLFTPGELRVTAYLAPSLDFVPGQGLRIGVSVDGGPIQVVNAVGKLPEVGFDEGEWSTSVIRNIRTVETVHQVEKPGAHTLKVWMADPIVVLQKLVLVTEGGCLKRSYLGPAETYYGGKPPVALPKEAVLPKGPDSPAKSGFDLDPDLRWDGVLDSKPLALQLGLFNRERIGRRYSIEAVLQDDGERQVDAAATTGYIRQQERLLLVFNLADSGSKDLQFYTLKIRLVSGEESSVFSWKLAAPSVRGLPGRSRLK